MIPTDSGPYEILTALAPQAASYLCVGVQEGVCLEHVIRANPKIRRLTLCDTWGLHHGGTGRGNHEHITRLLFKWGWGGTVQFLDGPSAVLVPRLITGESSLHDLTYVDGDHSAAAALTDMLNVWPLTGQAMVVHDVHMPSVNSALLEFLVQINHPTVDLYTGGTGTAVVYR